MPLPAMLRHYRERARYSQEEAAVLIGCTAQTIDNWERGKAAPHVSKLGALVRAWRIPAYRLRDALLLAATIQPTR